MKRGFRILIGVVVIAFPSTIAMMGLVDFTDAGQIGSLTKISEGYGGAIHGVINFNQNHDGYASTGCESNGGALKCDKDGTGIGDNDIAGYGSGDGEIAGYGAGDDETAGYGAGDDETAGYGTGDNEIAGYGTGGQTLTLAFDRLVNINGFHFLDLYDSLIGSGDKEQAAIPIDGVLFGTVYATGSNGDGRNESLIKPPKLAQVAHLTAAADPIYWNDSNNEYALVDVKVSAVPLPATIWLFATALAGFGGIRRIVK